MNNKGLTSFTPDNGKETYGSSPLPGVPIVQPALINESDIPDQHT